MRTWTWYVLIGLAVACLIAAVVRYSPTYIQMGWTALIGAMVVYDRQRGGHGS